MIMDLGLPISLKFGLNAQIVTHKLKVWIECSIFLHVITVVIK